METRYLSVSWEQYHSFAQSLAATILSRHNDLDQIVAISRGGLTLGHLLSDLLRIPISTITIQSYIDIQTHGEAKITSKLTTPIKNKKVLLVDDVSDSGKTLKRAVSYLRHFGPRKILTVSLFYKPHSVYKPDYFARQTTKWILFPYEPAEMILLISKSLSKEGKTKAEIQKFLESLGYSDNQIKFVRRYHLQND